MLLLIHTRTSSLQWRHNGRDDVSNHQPRYCLLNRLFRRKSKKTSKLRVTGLCAGNSPVTGEFLTQMASYAKIVSIWWRHHDHIISSTAAPRFIRRNRPVDSNVTVGDDHTFRCRTEAEPLAEIQWMINGEPVDREGKWRFYRRHILSRFLQRKLL